MASLLLADHHANANGPLTRRMAKRGRLTRRLRVRLRVRGLAGGADLSGGDADVRQEAVVGGSGQVGEVRLADRKGATAEGATAEGALSAGALSSSCAVPWVTQSARPGCVSAMSLVGPVP